MNLLKTFKSFKRIAEDEKNDPSPFTGRHLAVKRSSYFRIRERFSCGLIFSGFSFFGAFASVGSALATTSPHPLIVASDRKQSCMGGCAPSLDKQSSQLPAILPSQPHRPTDGEKLGYSKDESKRRLMPEVISFLDGILRLYKEPGLFANKSELFYAIGTQPGRRVNFENSIQKDLFAAPFRQYAAPTGLFSRNGWSASYTYSGRESNPVVWHARLYIEIPYREDCIDSRAVEGYLDLYLVTGLEGKPHPVSADKWDRHGAYGLPYAVAASDLTPGIQLGFIGGCLSEIVLAAKFNYRDLSDDSVFN